MSSRSVSEATSPSLAIGGIPSGADRHTADRHRVEGDISSCEICRVVKVKEEYMTARRSISASSQRKGACSWANGERGKSSRAIPCIAGCYSHTSVATFQIPDTAVFSTYTRWLGAYQKGDKFHLALDVFVRRLTWSRYVCAVCTWARMNHPRFFSWTVKSHRIFTHRYFSWFTSS